MFSRKILWRIKKPLRTAQSYFPSLKEKKDTIYRAYRRLLQIPSDPDFAALPLFSELKGSYVDIGGNTGQSIESIRLYVPDARIISFEPNPGLAARLSERYRNDPLITIRPVGLAEERKRMLLHVPSYNGFVYDGLGSLDLEEATSWLNRDTIYGFKPRHLRIQSHDCAIETLDAQNLLDPIFIKVDVEGTEYNVIKGGLETIRKNEPVLLLEGLHEKPPLQALLKHLGYSPYKFERGSLVGGMSGANTFLITDGRMAQISHQR